MISRSIRLNRQQISRYILVVAAVYSALAPFVFYQLSSKIFGYEISLIRLLYLVFFVGLLCLALFLYKAKKNWSSMSAEERNSFTGKKTVPSQANFVFIFAGLASWFAGRWFAESYLSWSHRDAALVGLFAFLPAAFFSGSFLFRGDSSNAAR